MRWRRIFGVEGIRPNENPNAIIAAHFFDTILVIILLWLPFQWYFQDHGWLSHQFIELADWIIWSAFLAEAITLSVLVNHPWRYFRQNWLTVIVIVLAFPILWDFSSSYVAFIRYLRLLVILRLTSVQALYMYRILRRNHFGSTILSFFVITILSGVFIGYFDPSLSPPWKGIWWAWETITTVGYGDIVPQTIPGKVFAALLMVMGVCLVSIVAANFAAFLLGGPAQKKDIESIKQHIHELDTKIDRLLEQNSSKE